MENRLRKLALHERPHYDEIVGVWLMKRFGEDHGFPGAADAEIVFWKSGGATPDGRSASEWEKDGTLAIGTGGGRLDEHPNLENSRKENECAATLVAKALGLEDDPGLAPILKFAVQNDLSGAGHPSDLAHVLKDMLKNPETDPYAAIDWLFKGLDAQHWVQEQFLDKAWDEFYAAAEVEEVSDGNGGTYAMVTVKSDNPEIAKFSRSRFGAMASIVIQRLSSGQTLVFTQKQFRPQVQPGDIRPVDFRDFLEIARMIRSAERIQNGIGDDLPWRELEIEGVVPGSENWFVHYKLQAILNGGRTASDTPATKLNLQAIQEFVRIALDRTSFEPSRQDKCRSGNCTSRKDNPCDWYDLGLFRCRNIRFRMHQAKALAQRQG